VTLAFMFIGQGTPPPWVTRDVLGDRDVVPLIDVASEATGMDIARLLIAGGRELAKTEIEQPTIVAVCLGLCRMLARAGVAPGVVMGHSLGELTAWAAAGAISDEDAVRIAAVRGRLMAREAARSPGGLARLIGDRATCERAIAAGAAVGSMCIAAYNAEDEWALAGDEPALAAVIAQFRARRLPQTGAWHSPAMAGAVDELRAALGALPRQALRARFLANRDGSDADGETIPELLAGQLVRPVRWLEMVRTADALGVQRYIAVGPGKTLRGLIHRELGVARSVTIVDNVRSVAECG